MIKSTARSFTGFFPAVLLLGTVNAALAGWWLLPEMLRSHPTMTAGIGMARPDLWLVDGAALSAAANPEDAKSAIERSLLYAPMNPAAWLAMALANERLDWVNHSAAKALKMSYYTGFNDRTLVARRLEILARTDSKGDAELSDILKRQTRLIVTQAPEMKPAIVAAYATATPANKSVIEDELQDLDPDLLATLRTH